MSKKNDLPKALRDIKTQDGLLLVTGEFLYHVYALLRSHSQQDVIEMVTNVADSKNQREAYFRMPYFADAELKRQLVYETYQAKTIPPVDKSISCPKCGSNNVVTEGKYVRALDEAGVATNTCRQCGNKFQVD